MRIQLTNKYEGEYRYGPGKNIYCTIPRHNLDTTLPTFSDPAKSTKNNRPDRLRPVLSSFCLRRIDTIECDRLLSAFINVGALARFVLPSGSDSDSSIEKH